MAPSSRTPSRNSFAPAKPAAIAADAIVLGGVFAFGRYGGRPRHDVAQILRNNRADGFPPLVVIPPTVPVVFDERRVPVVREDFADVKPAHHAVSKTLEALRDWNERGESPVNTVVYHLPMLGMDSPADRSTPKSFRRALEELAGSSG